MLSPMTYTLTVTADDLVALFDGLIDGSDDYRLSLLADIGSQLVRIEHRNRLRQRCVSLGYEYRAPTSASTKRRIPR